MGTRENWEARSSCFDMRNLRGTTFEIPSNVSRLDQQGIGICSPLYGGADIVFIMDNSGSMASLAGMVSLNGLDTSYFYGTCTGGINGTLTIPDLDVLPVSTRTIPRLDGNTNCDTYSGDPYQARGSAIRQAIDYMAKTGPNSSAGYIGFGTTAQDQSPPVRLNSQNVVNTLKSQVVLGGYGGTNYALPLALAKQWLNDKNYLFSKSQAIVFISDGAPTAGSEGLDLIDSLMPPIYSIFLGKKSVPDTAVLMQLSSLSQGKFYRVPPDRPDSLNGVIRTILNFYATSFDPVQVSITNTSRVPNQTSQTYGFIPQTGNTRWRMVFDNRMDLLPNSVNDLTMMTTFRDTINQVMICDTIPFKLSTTLAPAMKDTKIPNSEWQVLCSPTNQAAHAWFANASGGPSVSFYASSTSQAYITIQDNASVPGALYRITVTSDSLKDQQLFTLRESPSGVFSAAIPLHTSATALTGDGRLQISRSGDQIHMVYEDPIFGDIAVANATILPFGTSLKDSVHFSQNRTKLLLRQANGGQTHLFLPPETVEWQTVSMRGTFMAKGYGAREALLPNLSRGLYVVRAKMPAGLWLQARFFLL